MTDSHMTLEMAQRAMKSIAIKKLVEIIVPHVRSPDDSLRQARDKVRQRVVYAVEKNDPQVLAAIGVDNNFTLNIEQAAIWARTKWPSIDLGPAHHILPPVREVIGVHDAMYDWMIPGDIARCQASLEAAHKIMRAMRDELKRLRVENAHLAPLAHRYEEICEANRKSARIPRKGRD